MAEQKAEISYPTPWGYKIIGKDIDDLKEIAKEVMGEKSFSAEEGKKSSSGKYQTLTLETVVFSEEERLGLFDTFKEHPTVLAIL